MSDLMGATTDLDRLANFLASIGSFSEDLILFFNVEERLYHYTDLGGFHGIATTDDLWLTHAQFCNDEAELTYGQNLTEAIIAKQLDAADLNQKVYLQELLRLLCGPELDPVYICCFCERDDLLSQWRAYAANAGGVSVEVQPARFSYITGPDCPPRFGLLRFWKVFYELEQQQKIVRSAIKYYPTQEPAAAPSDWARWTAEAIRFFRPTFKNEDFAEEREWRLIFTPAPGSIAQPSYRRKGGMLAPFYSLKELANVLGLAAQKLPITSVRIGPGPNRKLNATSARMLLDRHGYSDAKVFASATPYRG
jgi:hypothetical protein